jgi:hypothetical protein
MPAIGKTLSPVDIVGATILVGPSFIASILPGFEHQLLLRSYLVSEGGGTLTVQKPKTCVDPIQLRPAR